MAQERFDELYNIVKALNAKSGQRQIFQDVVDIIEKEMGMPRATIMLLSPQGDKLIIEAAKNVKSDQPSYNHGEGITGRVLQGGKPIVLERISQEPAFKKRIHHRNDQEIQQLGFVCVPIIIGKEIVGTLAADIPVSNFSPDQAKKILSIIASLISHDVKLRRHAEAERLKLENENRRLRNELQDAGRPENMIGNSRLMHKVYQRIQQVADSDTTVLIRGESGTGKELVAAAIHYNSPRYQMPFVTVNCAALSESLLESELFGHEKGSFTGAVSDRIGRLEEARGGTLFLDEIGEFSPAIQVKLLRVLQEREFQRVGSNKTIKVDIRVIAATNRNLEKAVEDGSFRSDLFYRINVVPIHLPALRDRKDDIMQLCDHFIQKFSRRMGRKIHRISTSAINMMQLYHWPGNVRELENCIEHAVLLSDNEVIHGYNLPPTLQMPDDDRGITNSSLKGRVNMLEREAIVDSLKRNNGSVVSAAKELEITPRMIRYKIKNLKIDYQRYFKK